MRHQVNVHEAKSRLSRLIASAEAGEEVIIARANKPFARLRAELSTRAQGALAPSPEQLIREEREAR